jgi:hypothetical protein
VEECGGVRTGAGLELGPWVSVGGVVLGVVMGVSESAEENLGE